MNLKESTSVEILAMFSAFKERRIRLYQSFIEDLIDFEDWSIPLERLLAYYITLKKVKNYSYDLKDKVQKEIIRLTEGDFTVN